MKKDILAAGCAILLVQASGLKAQDPDFSQSGWIKSYQTGGSARTGAKFETPAPFKELTAGGDIAKTPESENYDAEMGVKLARAAETGNLGYFNHSCYEYVAYHMQNAGVIRPEQWDQLKIGPDHAVDFAIWAVDNPETMRKELKLARITTPSDKAEIPIGSIIVYGKGVCGFSKSSGHIEVLVRPDWACSDGCESLDQNCFSDAATREQIYVITPVKAGSAAPSPPAEAPAYGAKPSGD